MQQRRRSPPLLLRIIRHRPCEGLRRSSPSGGLERSGVWVMVLPFVGCGSSVPPLMPFRHCVGPISRCPTVHGFCPCWLLGRGSSIPQIMAFIHCVGPVSRCLTVHGYAPAGCWGVGPVSPQLLHSYIAWVQHPGVELAWNVSYRMLGCGSSIPQPVPFIQCVGPVSRCYRCMGFVPTVCWGVGPVSPQLMAI